MNIMRKAGATVALTGSLLLTGGALASPAFAQVQDGLVNVAVGDVTILEDVRVGVAANVVAQVCGLKVGPVAVLARQVDAGGDAVVDMDCQGVDHLCDSCGTEAQLSLAKERVNE